MTYERVRPLKNDIKLNPQHYDDMDAALESQGSAASLSPTSTDFGASTTRTAAENTVRFRACFDQAISTGASVYIPAGTYPLASGLLWSNDAPRISGAGRKTILNFTDHAANLLTIGSNSGSDTDLGSAGWLEQFSIVGPGAPALASPDYHAALNLNHVRHLRVSQIYVAGMDVGVDLTNNCYGTHFDHLMSPYSTCNVAVRLRHGTQSGDDIAFWYPWLGGKKTAFWMESLSGDGTGGYRIVGGQISSSGIGSDDTTSGAVMVGSSYDGSTSGGAVDDVLFQGVLFEGIGQKNAFWTTGECDFVVRQCRFNGGGTLATAMLGLLTAAGNDHNTYRFDSCRFENQFRNGAPIVLANNSGHTTVIESYSVGQPVVNSVGHSLYTDTSMTELSSLGASVWKYVLRGGL